MTSSVSIAMATYNGAAYLGEQLASFAAQTRRPDELVISDDLSDDATVEIAERFAAEAPFPVRIHRNPQQLGLHRNFERAMGLAGGELILVSDQDDVWFPIKVERILAEFGARPDVLAVQHDERIMDQSTGQILPGTLLERTRQIGGWGQMLAAGNCTALRRDIVPILLPLPDGFFYDSWINWLPELLGARSFLDEPLQAWRRHGANASCPAIAEEKPSRWKGYWQYGREDPRPGWAAYRDHLAAIRDRIAEQAERIDKLLGQGRAAAGAQRATSRIEALDQRISLLVAPRLRRWRPLLGLWARGFYKDFSGWRSAVKDLLTS